MSLSRSIRAAAFVALMMIVWPLDARAQADTARVKIPPPMRMTSMAGPRFGFTYLSRGIVDTLKSRDIDVNPVISQFGWQFEHQFYSSEGGPAVLNEWVLLLGGLEEGNALPSLSWIVGVRARNGAEFGVGPNFSPGGVALAIGGGVTTRIGALAVPVNVAYVQSGVGGRLSILTGFSIRRANYDREPRVQPRSPQPPIRPTPGLGLPTQPGWGGMPRNRLPRLPGT
jgi:hypothetical protein